MPIIDTALVLEFFARVKQVEERLGDLEQAVQQLEASRSMTLPEDAEPTDSPQRSQIIRWVADEIAGHNPGVTVHKVPRALTVERSGRTLSVKVSYSHPYGITGSSHFGWYTLDNRALESRWDLYVFVFWDAEQPRTVWFTHDQLVALCQGKKPDARNRVHLYFDIRGDRACETRGETPIDVSDHLDRWTLPMELLTQGH